MALARDLAARTADDISVRRSVQVRDALARDGLYASSPSRSAVAASALDTESASASNHWRIAPVPFMLSSQELSFLESLGHTLLAFYRALNRLYADSVRGIQPPWVAAYLDQGKPESLIAYSRMKRFRDHLPAVIRPDIIPTDTGLIITELDAVPGGIGLTGSLGRAYAAPELASVEIVGGANGMVQGFAKMLAGLTAVFHDSLGGDGDEGPPVTVIVVSDESKDYRPEMQWLAGQLRESGQEVYCIEPRDIRFTEHGLRLSTPTSERSVAVLYRFFELFDLKNIPKAELMMYSAKKGQVLVTPPFKPQLEEKLAFALFHHLILTSFWRRELGEDSQQLLTGLIPKTWILDPRSIPPTAIIPGLTIGQRPVADWRELTGAAQKDRRYVVKPSGFSELAWGSRGVSIGHDLSQVEWTAALDKALMSFPHTPYVLQEFHKGRQFTLSYLHEQGDEIVPMAGRARLSPYYFVRGERAELAGVLATLCPPDKKVIHGMRDAVMVPCAVAKNVGPSSRNQPGELPVSAKGSR